MPNHLPAFSAASVTALLLVISPSQGQSGSSFPPTPSTQASHTQKVSEYGSTSAETAALEKIHVQTRSGFVEHAPLAIFSLGSLAVGGVFYSIHSRWDGEKGSFSSGSRSEMSVATGAAGITALLAGATYFYYANHSPSKPAWWNAEVSGSLTASGMAAVVSIPVNTLLP